MNLNKFLIFLLSSLFLNLGWTQSNFEFSKNRVKDKVDFTLVNNLVLIPVLVNDVPLNFLLDTGASSTVIFSFEETDSIELHNYTLIKLRGLGKGEPVDALKSEGNTIQIGKAISDNQTIYVVFEGALNFSSRLGHPVHGIIGNDFLKNFVVEINNVRERMRFFLPEYYRKKRCRRCVKKDLIFHKDKPYLTAKFKEGNIEMDVHLLIDSGSGDGLWLFENSDPQIDIPDNAFEDYLGLGINGNIYGKRSKVNQFVLGKFTLENVNTSYPDVDFLDVIKEMGSRNGSLGGEILKRFNWTISYTDKFLILKKNKFFKVPFHYNMSGITLEQGGFALVSERVQVNSNQYQPTIPFKINLSDHLEINLKELFKVVAIRENSPAHLAGIQIGDEILEVNKKRSYNYDLNEINQLFYNNEGKTIRMKILRNGVEQRVEFELKDL